MQRAIDLARSGMNEQEGGPFGCVIVKEGKIIGEGNNRVTSTNDPTAHAEIVAIRDACKNIQSFQLDKCEIYTSCEPCPMCLGAIYWARPSKIYYACTREDAAEIGFDDALIYRELELPAEQRIIPLIPLAHTKGIELFEEWKNKSDKIQY